MFADRVGVSIAGTTGTVMNMMMRMCRFTGMGMMCRAANSGSPICCA